MVNVFVHHLSDSQLAARTMEMRNNIPVMKDIDGFEQFFHREVHKQQVQPCTHVTEVAHFERYNPLSEVNAMKFTVSQP